MEEIQTYENVETRRLSNLYDIATYKSKVIGTMGAFENEKTAFLFLSESRKKNRIVGIKKGDLEHLAEENHCDGYDLTDDVGSFILTIEYLINWKYVKPEIIEGYEVLFPTEAILTNQKIPKK